MLKGNTQINILPTVDVLIPMPDIIYSAFVVDTLLPLLQEPVVKRVLVKPGMRTEYSREILLHDFLSGPNEWVFLLDADMVLPPRALPRLLSWNKKVVTGLYFGRGANCYPVPFMDEPIGVWPKTRLFDYPDMDRPSDALIEVGATGHGCFLIHRSVLEQLEPPYAQLGPFNGQPVVGSDLRLCLKIRKETGEKIWCDTSIKCGHLRPYAVGEKDYLGMKEHLKAEWEQHRTKIQEE